MRKAVWKRRLASAIIVTMLTGTFSNALTVAAPTGRAYAATPGDASYMDGIALLEDLPEKGDSSTYYVEDANEVELVISEETIRAALETEEPELNLELLGYEDLRAVVGLYEEIMSVTEDYRLVEQGTLADDELSYFAYVKEDKKGEELFEELSVIVVNPNAATEGDSAYNVYLRYAGDEYRLDGGEVQLLSMTDLSIEQIEEQDAALEIEGPVVDVVPVSGGGAGGGSSAGGSGSEDVIVIIPEVNGSETETVTPSIDSTELQTTVTYNADDADRVFHNTYRLATASTWLTGTKKLSGTETDNWKKDGWFRFQIQEVTASGSDWIPADGGYTVATANDADGKFAVELIYAQDDLKLEEAQTFYYKVTEQNDAADRPYITYDDGWYVVKVTIEDTGAGELKVSEPEIVAGSAEMTGGTAVFENVYTASGQIAFEGTKILDGREFKDNDIFKFHLYRDGKLVETAELKPLENGGKTIDGVTYSDKVWQGTYEIVDHADGTLTADYVSGDDLSQNLAFTNVYKRGNASFTPKFRKLMSGRRFRESDVFTFTLVRTAPDGTVTASQKEIKPRDGFSFDGAFDTESFDMSDIGKTYRYELYEEKGSISRVRYDEKHYLLEAKITDDGNENLTVTVTCEGAAFGIAEFTNRYTSGGGGGNNGGGGGGGNTPGRPTIIDEPGLPLSSFPVELIDEEIPLAALAKTGDTRPNYGLFVFLSGLAFAACALLGKKKKEEDEQN